MGRGRRVMQDRREDRSSLAVAGWFAVAAALRLLFLGRFSLWGDEIYSLEDALDLFTPRVGAGDLAFPLFFLLERAVLELTGLARATDPDPLALQWALRIVPAIAGAAAAAAAFHSSRGFLARRDRHLLAALIAFSPWLLFFSQTARFYTLVLALATPATFELLRAARDASVKRGVIGAAWLLLATLAHPTALFLLAGHAAASFAAALLRVRPLNRGHVPPLLIPVLLAIPASIWPAAVDPLLFRWNVRDAGVESAGGLLLGIGWNVGPVVAALAFLGIPSTWRGDRALAVHVVAGAGVPVLLLLALAMGEKSVEQRYLLAILPLALLPAARFLGEIADDVAARARAPAWAPPVLALLPYGPGVVSAYLDGNRHDLAGAAAVVRAGLEPGDGVIAETHALFRRYLPPGFPEERLLEAPPPATRQERERFAAMWKECPRIWLVVPAEFEGSGDPHRSFHQWAWSEGRLVRELWRPRLDYHQNRLRVFRVEPRAARRWH